MIVREVFEGDNDQFLMNIQHQEYDNHIWMLFDIAKTEYIHAELILNVQTELGVQLREAISFDHRVMQNLHDIIAANFRYLHPDSKQFSLFKEDGHHTEKDLEERLRAEWKSYFKEKAIYIGKNPNFCRQILNAIIYDKEFILEDFAFELFEIPVDSLNADLSKSIYTNKIREFINRIIKDRNS